jgi:hypothetical protein
VFRPRIPEGFTSPGPVMITHDASGNRLPVPEIRQQPVIAAHDGGNTTFFSGDTGATPTPRRTSSAPARQRRTRPPSRPRAAGEGRAGQRLGRGHEEILINSAFPHDLDPYCPWRRSRRRRRHAHPHGEGGPEQLERGAQWRRDFATALPFVGPIDFKVVNVSYTAPLDRLAPVQRAARQRDGRQH